MAETKLAVAYLRCSDPSQDLSIEQQRAVVLDYAAKHKLRVIEWYEDDGVSGWRKKARRRGYERLMRALRLKRLEEAGVTRLLVWKLNRVGRNQVSVLSSLMEFENADIEVLSTTEVWPEERKLRRLLQSLIALMDEFYSENLSEDVKRGMAFQAQRGRWVAGKPYPYGYTAEVVEKGRAPRLVKVPHEAETIKKIVRMYLVDGDGDRKIAQRLTLERDPAPARRKRRDGRAPIWTKKHVKRILTRPVYRGQIVYDKVVACEQAHEPLISDADWHAIQQTRSERKKTGARRNPARVGLQGIYTTWLVCPLCGAGVTITPGGQPTKRLYYYSCGAYAQNPEACHGFSVRCDEIDPLITQVITEQLLSRENLRRLVEASLERLGNKPDGSVAARRERLTVEKRELTAEINNLILLAGGPDSSLSELEELRDRLTLLRVQRTGVQQDLSELPEPMAALTVEDIDLEGFRRSILDAFEAKSAQEKRASLKNFIHEIRLDIDSRSAVIEYAWMGEGSDYQGQVPYGPP